MVKIDIQTLDITKGENIRLLKTRFDELSSKGIVYLTKEEQKEIRGISSILSQIG